MNERQCERCGKNITHKPHTIADDVLGICSECAGDLDEFMNGAPVLKWNPVKVRPITEEELEGIPENRREEAKEVGYLDGFLPEDGQEILITVRGNGGGYVSPDICYFNGIEYSLDSGECWEDVTGWADMPEPFIPDEEEAEE